MAEGERNVIERQNRQRTNVPRYNRRSMAEDKPIKSSYDLAMERLRKKDADEGVESRPVTDAQKAAIAEVRNFYEAKMAEQQVLYQSALRTTADPEARATLEQQYRRDRERFTSERDSKIEKIRRDG
jgi:hypothetical protein